MQQAKVTFKGQITIPKAVRDALDIREGDSVAFQVENGHAVVKPLRKKALSHYFGVFPAKRPYPGHETIRKEARHMIVERLTRRKPA